MKRWIAVFVVCLTVGVTRAQTYKEYVEQALAAMATDSLDEAERQFREAMKAEPAQRSNAMLYCQLARIYERKGKYERAVEYYTTGLNIAPHIYALRKGRGSLYLQLGQLDKALSDYNDVLDGRPEDEEALLARAYINKEKRLYKNARMDYETLVRLNPQNEAALVGLVLVNEKDNRPREAMEQINAMVTAAPGKALFYAIRAGMEQTRKQYEAAEEDFAKALSLEPDNVDYLLSRASFYIECRRKKEARADLERALQLGADAQEVASMMRELR